MPSPVYTILFGRHYGSETTAPIAIIPDDASTYVVRDVVLTNHDSADHLLVLYIHTGTVGFWLAGGTIGPGTPTHFEMRQVVLANNQLTVYTDAAAWSTTVTGYAFGGGSARSLTLPDPLPSGYPPLYL